MVYGKGTAAVSGRSATTRLSVTLNKHFLSSLPAGLPSPTADAQAVSERLIECVRTEIDAAGGMLSFARFMNLALYTPGLGYYCAGSRKFGAEGDFVTAPEVSDLFSRCVARQCAEILTEVRGGSILEFGAGSGVMAAEVLKELESLRQLPETYLIMELSAELRARQRETLELRVPHLLARVRWLDILPSSMRGVVLANELVDAMPVHRFTATDQGFAEAYVRRDGDAFAWASVDLKEGEVLEAIKAVRRALDEVPWPPGYTSEINLAGSGWIRSLGEMLREGAALIIDYGFPRREFYHQDRQRGTLMCHYRHHVHDNPLVLIGLQDITSHVDFTALADAALEVNLAVAGYTTQAHFLLGCGLLQLLECASGDDKLRHLAMAQQVKRLTLPNEMGELFKALVLTKNFDKPLMGFSLVDHRARL